MAGERRLSSDSKNNHAEYAHFSRDVSSVCRTIDFNGSYSAHSGDFLNLALALTIMSAFLYLSAFIWLILLKARDEVRDSVWGTLIVVVVFTTLSGMAWSLFFLSMWWE